MENESRRRKERPWRLLACGAAKALPSDLAREAKQVVAGWESLAKSIARLMRLEFLPLSEHEDATPGEGAASTGGEGVSNQDGLATGGARRDELRAAGFTTKGRAPATDDAKNGGRVERRDGNGIRRTELVSEIRETVTNALDRLVREDEPGPSDVLSIEAARRKDAEPFGVGSRTAKPRRFEAWSPPLRLYSPRGKEDAAPSFRQAEEQAAWSGLADAADEQATSLEALERRVKELERRRGVVLR